MLATRMKLRCLSLLWLLPMLTAPQLATCSASICSIHVVGGVLKAPTVTSASVQCSGSQRVPLVVSTALSAFTHQFEGVDVVVQANATALFQFSKAQLTIQDSSIVNVRSGSSWLLSINSDSSVALRNTTFAGNSAEGSAGALLIQGSNTVAISNCTFHNNAAGAGGSSLCINGSAAVQATATTFTSNGGATLFGGAIKGSGPSNAMWVLQDMMFSNNSVGCSGGAISLTGASLSVSQSTFQYNVARGLAVCQTGNTTFSVGGAVAHSRFGSASFRDVRFLGNQAPSAGAVAQHFGVNVTVTNSSFIDNVAFDTTANELGGFGGGALALDTMAVVNVNNSNFTSNRGTWHGAVIIHLSENVNVQNNTFLYNTALPNRMGISLGGALLLNESCHQSACSVWSNRFMGNRAGGSSSAGGSGGGVMVFSNFGGNSQGTSLTSNSLIDITNNVFDGNSAGGSGGAVGVISTASQIGTAQVIGNTFINNTVLNGTAGDGGGAVSLKALGAITLQTNQFVGNSAPGNGTGGALNIAGSAGTQTSRVIVGSNMFYGNTCGTDGGAMAVTYVAAIDITSCNFTSNVGGRGGGVFMNDFGETDILACTFHNNSATGLAPLQQGGGGMYMSNLSNGTIALSTFYNNTAQQGGGLMLFDISTGQLMDLEFLNNTASTPDHVNKTAFPSYGGGLHQEHSNIIGLIGSSFLGNRAQQGGGMSMGSFSTLISSGTNFTANTASDSGGGLAVQAVLVGLNLSSTTFLNNTSGADGGGMAVNKAVMAVWNNCAFINNTATADDAGGLSFEGGSSVAFANTTFLGNSAFGQGGGANLNSLTVNATTSIDACTFKGNSAAQGGGAVALVQSPSTLLTLDASDLAGNDAMNGSALLVDQGVSVQAAGTDLVVQGVDTPVNLSTPALACLGCQFIQDGVVRINFVVPDGFAMAPGQTLGTGALVGIAVGAAFGAVLVGLLVLMALRRRSLMDDYDMQETGTTMRHKTASTAKLLAWLDTGRRGSSKHSPPHTLTRMASHGGPLQNPLRMSSSWSRKIKDGEITASEDGTPVNVDSVLNLRGAPEDWAPWQIKPEDLKNVTDSNGELVVLGKGGFGEVYLAKLNGVTPVAVKRLRAEHGDVSRRDEFLREVSLLKALSHSHVVQFQGACLTGSELLLVTEYMEGGDVFKAISNKKINWWQRGGRTALDIASGLHFLHSKRIVHLDLKTPNVLLNRHGTAKLADVGLAKIQHQNYVTAQSAALGTFAWAAPELLTNQKCTEKADIFSFGIVLWEIATGETPMRGRMRNVRVPEECPAEIAALIERCMGMDPHKRPTAQEAHDILRESLWQQAAEKRRLMSGNSRDGSGHGGVFPRVGSTGNLAQSRPRQILGATSQRGTPGMTDSGSSSLMGSVGGSTPPAEISPIQQMALGLNFIAAGSAPTRMPSLQRESAPAFQPPMAEEVTRQKSIPRTASG